MAAAAVPKLAPSSARESSAKKARARPISATTVATTTAIAIARAALSSAVHGNAPGVATRTAHDAISPTAIRRVAWAGAVRVPSRCGLRRIAVLLGGYVGRRLVGHVGEDFLAVLHRRLTASRHRVLLMGFGSRIGTAREGGARCGVCRDAGSIGPVPLGLSMCCS